MTETREGGAAAARGDRRDRRDRLWPHWWEPLLIASVAAFAGGVAVVGVQFTLGQVSAGYPPMVQSLACAEPGAEPGVNLALAEERGAVLPLVEVAAGSTLECRLDAPGADYATWSVVGPHTAVHAGPIDTDIACQSPDAFATQSTGELRLSPCQQVRFEQPGFYVLTTAVMVRGQPTVDRTSIAVRVGPGAGPSSAARTALRIQTVLAYPARDAEETRTGEVSAEFSEHGFLPDSRDFTRTVYTLRPDETYLGASFRARSAANASAVTFAYEPASRTVKARFTLRSGPIVDRWRGWITGTAVVRVRIKAEARDVPLPEIRLDLPGEARLPLPDGVQLDGARVVLRDADTGGEVALAPGGTGQLDQARIALHADPGVLVIAAEPAAPLYTGPR